MGLSRSSRKISNNPLLLDNGLAGPSHLSALIMMANEVVFSEEANKGESMKHYKYLCDNEEDNNELT